MLMQRSEQPAHAEQRARFAPSARAGLARSLANDLKLGDRTNFGAEQGAGAVALASRGEEILCLTQTCECLGVEAQSSVEHVQPRPPTPPSTLPPQWVA